MVRVMGTADVIVKARRPFMGTKKGGEREKKRDP